MIVCFQDLIERCLERQPDERISLEEIKTHPWLTIPTTKLPAAEKETSVQHMNNNNNNKLDCEKNKLFCDHNTDITINN